MSMGEMFGSPVGRRLAEQDMAALAYKQAQIDLVPFTAQQRSAQARWLNTRAAGAEQDAETERRVAAMMQNDPPSVEEGNNPGWKIAEFYNQAGSPSKSMKAAEKASLIDQHLASADTNISRKSFIQTRERLAQLDELGRAMHSVNGPETLQAQLQRHEQSTGERTGILDEQGNLPPQFAERWEELRNSIQRESVSEKDRLAAEHRTKQLESIDQERASRQNARTFWQSMENQEERAAAQARGRGVKVGADVLSKSEGTKLGTDFINDQFVGLDPAQAKVYGRQLTERAQQLRQKNPALTPLEAIKEASNVMKDEGVFEGLKPRPARANASTPLPLPLDGDRSKLKPGYYYTDGKTVNQWTGTGWKVKGKIGSKSTLATPEDNSDAENAAADEAAMGGGGDDDEDED